MVKVLIVVWGLVLVVPDGPPEEHPEGVTALFLATDAWPHISEHRASVHQFGTHLDMSAIGPGFELVLEVPAEGAVDLAGLAHLAALGDLTPDPEDALVRRDCLDGAPSCALGGKSMVAGRARFEGPWRTRPASRCAEFELPLGYRDQVLWDFRPEGDLGRSGDSHRRLATALVLETQVADLANLKMQVHAEGASRNIDLFESPSDICEDFLGEPGACVVIELANGAVDPIPGACRGLQDDPTECRADRHFAAFYDLLVSPPEPRLIPFIAENYLQCDSKIGIGNQPAPLCPPPTALPAPMEEPSR